MPVFILYSSCKLIVLAFVLERRARKKREAPACAEEEYVILEVQS
jgi:hypothetical protein